MGSGSGVFQICYPVRSAAFPSKYGVSSPFLTIKLNSTHPANHPAQPLCHHIIFPLTDQTTPAHKLVQTFIKAYLSFTFRKEGSPDLCFSSLHLLPYLSAILPKYQSDYVSSLFNNHQCLPM